MPKASKSILSAGPIFFGSGLLKPPKNYCVQGLQDQKKSRSSSTKKCRCFSYNDVDTCSCPKTPFMPAKKTFLIRNYILVFWCFANPPTVQLSFWYSLRFVHVMNYDVLTSNQQDVR